MFEAATDAIVTGNVATLHSLLAQDPDLVRARSDRLHRATLLHYVGANGVEQERQVSPRNAVDIAKVLLDASSEVDALADIYGQSATLALVASSVHPKRTGVQIPLMEVLLTYGADRNGSSGGSPLLAALRNGHAEAAEFLADRNAVLDLEGAAGVGRLDRVKEFVSPDGSLQAGATKAQRELGFLWACEYGRTEIVRLLLDRGADLQADGETGLTGLHWAVVGAKLDAIDQLLERGAALESVNKYGGTPVDQAAWSAIHGDPSIDYLPVIQRLLQAGARVREGIFAWLSQQTERSLAERSRIAEALGGNLG